MRFFKSFGYAWNGLKYCFTTQTNFRIHLLIMVLVIAAGFVLHISNYEWLMVLLCIGFVLALEMINTAIEKLCDVDYPDHNPQIKIIKDLAAGAVLICAIISAVIGLVIFLPKILEIIKTVK